jgi:hypothetical protein
VYDYGDASDNGELYELEYQAQDVNTCGKMVAHHTAENLRYSRENDPWHGEADLEEEEEEDNLRDVEDDEDEQDNMEEDIPRASTHIFHARRCGKYFKLGCNLAPRSHPLFRTKSCSTTSTARSRGRPPAAQAMSLIGCTPSSSISTR